MSHLKAAVVGVGYLGHFHLQKYQALDGVQLVAIVDTNDERGKYLSERYNVKHYSDYFEIIGCVDIVSIVVPPKEHFKVALDFLNGGVHCLIEKPITESVAQAEELISVAQKNSCILQVGHLERFNPSVKKLQEIVVNPVAIKSKRFAKFQKRGSDVDVILDLMIHDIDILLSLSKSRIKTVQAIGATIISPHVDIANANIEFYDGLVAELSASRVSSEALRESTFILPDRRVTVNYLTHETIESTLDGRQKFEETNLNLLFGKEGAKLDILYDEISSFVDSVKGGTLPLVTGEDGRKALELAILISQKIKNVADSDRKQSFKYGMDTNHLI